MDNAFELAHVGINTNDPQEAALLSEPLHLTPKHGNTSEFECTFFERMKAPYLGKNGHIALRTENLAAAVEELKEMGCTFRMDTVLYTESGKLKTFI